MRRVGWMLAAALMVATPSAWAAHTSVHDAAESMDYGRKFGGMIGRGALNVVTSPVDIIVNIVNDSKAGPPLVGTLTGIGKGLGCGVLRLGSGCVDLVTFWVPGFNGFPVSDSYDNCFAGTSVSASTQEFPSGQPAASTWEVPTSEPGAAQVPATSGEPSAPSPVPTHKKTWKK